MSEPAAKRFRVLGGRGVSEDALAEHYRRALEYSVGPLAVVESGLPTLVPQSRRLAKKKRLLQRELRAVQRAARTLRNLSADLRRSRPGSAPAAECAVADGGKGGGQARTRNSDREEQRSQHVPVEE